MSSNDTDKEERSYQPFLGAKIKYIKKLEEEEEEEKEQDFEYTRGENQNSSQ